MNPHVFKICQVSISLGKGGAERSCALLSQLFKNNGHEVHTVVLNDEVDYPFAGKLFNLGKLKHGKDTFTNRLKRFKKLREYLKKNDFDVIIDHRPKNNYWRELFYDRYLYRGIKRIYVVHSSLRENYFTEKPGKMTKIYNKNLANIAVSHFIQQEILINQGVKNSQVIHNAFDPNWGKTEGELPEKLKETTYLLWYGRIDNSVKDLPFLLEAFESSELWKKQVQLVIMGDGKDMEQTKKLASQLVCSKQILFLPFMKKPFPVVSSARAVVLTSKYEGFPMVLVESLSVGTPVVSLDIQSGPSEIIIDRKNGLLVGARSPELFAKSLREICLDDDLYKTCKAYAKNSVKDFSMEKIGKKWNEMLLSTEFI